MKLNIPRRGKLEQGMIFSSCAIDGYTQNSGWGVIITARCDLANFKMPILNYLPVVALEDWWKNDGLAVLQARCISEVESELKSLLKDLGAPETVLLGTPVDEALAVLVSTVDGKLKKALSNRVEGLLEKWRVAHSVSASSQTLRKRFPKHYSSVVRELMTHRLSGYYYLSRVDPNGPDSCFVVLLRQIGSMRSELANKISAGIRSNEAGQYQQGSGKVLMFDTSDSMAIPLGVIPSPHIEHLMQAFSLLFGRIGLPDTASTHIERFASPEII